MTDGEREKRLPLWAQHELTHLRGAIAAMQASTAALAGDPQQATVSWDAHVASGALPSDARVRFRLGTEAWHAITVHISDRGLWVAADLGRIVVEPVATNVIYVRGTT